MTVKPLGDRILVKMDEVKAQTASGLFIPQSAQEKTQIASVIAVGDDKEAITVKVGDKILHDKYAGTQIKIDGEELLIINMGDVLAVVE
ncbi:MAG: co-chaperone GroES [Sphaerochaetaceae bacterium]|jgi:chaperonin GroES|nr:co-chaperone GroES [Sphaerochaetaceae bacterium]MDC7237024.1 co-chaperone GroES [Sphaerochaetaceae bacterium]MDC7249677.1 co-chaperone GroES [Sphaerochaetaceae bacterium]